MTQEYTPVSWQDETTSQQGTLINAERLNQMQTAHHYADGFEEVDAVPAADPGVAYHKVVYCTADSTFYRWDGTEWTKDIDDDTKRLLEQEIARATEAEGELAQDLADETTARETAEAAMQADITAMQSGKVDKQTASPNQWKVYGVRGSSQVMISAGLGGHAVPLYGIDETLLTKMPTLYDPTDDTVVNYGWATAQIGAEATARAEADTLLGNRITDETTAREGADTALGNRITAEETRATQAEQANAQAIANTYTKAEADTLLGAKANDNAVVHLAGAETITGVKTFTRSDSDIMMILKSRRILAGTGTMYNIRINSNDDEELGNIASYKGSQQTSNYLSIKRGSTTAEVGAIVHDTQGAYGFAPTPGVSAPGIAIATLASLDNYAPMVRTTGNQTVLGEKIMPDINNNRVKLQTTNSNPGWRKIYSWQGGGSFNVIIRGNTGNRRNGDPILVSVAIGDPAKIGDGSTWNSLAKIVLGTASTKQVALAYDPDTTKVGFYYYFPPSEATVIEMIGTTSTIERSIAITPVEEDPSTFTAHVIL